MKTRWLAIILVLILVLSGGCSASKDYHGPGDGSSGDSENPGEGDFPRQVIYNVWLNLRVDNLERAVNLLAQEASSKGGFISESTRDNSRDEPWARITYRIPQDHYPAFLAYARGLGIPGQETVASTDVTEEYIDLEARLFNRRRHEESLANMYAQAKTVDELIQVERELARVREEIEVIEGRLRYLREKVALATVQITLTQQAGATEIPGLKPVGIGETLRRAGRAIVTSSTLFLDFLSFLVVAIAAILPFVLPLALVVFFLLRARRKRKTSA